MKTGKWASQGVVHPRSGDHCPRTHGAPSLDCLLEKSTASTSKVCLVRPAGDPHVLPCCLRPLDQGATRPAAPPLAFSISGLFCACDRWMLLFTRYERLCLIIKTFSTVILITAGPMSAVVLSIFHVLSFFFCFFAVPLFSSLFIGCMHCLLSSSRVKQQLCISADGYPSGDKMFPRICTIVVTSKEKIFMQLHVVCAG